MRWVMMGPSSGSTDSPAGLAVGVGSPCTVIVPVPRAVKAWFTEPLSGIVEVCTLGGPVRRRAGRRPRAGSR